MHYVERSGLNFIRSRTIDENEVMDTSAALGSYVRTVRSVRSRPQPAQAGALVLDPRDVSRFRLRRQSLHCRLPSDDLEIAAYGGLQDSAPRSALLALHARMEETHPGSWEDQRLVQIWFRWSDYVVPRPDVGMFTLGTLPRDAEQRAVLDQLAERVLSVLDGRSRPTRDVAAALPHLESAGLLRCSAATGKVHIRWDAQTITMHPAAPADIDEELARLELARRYLRWLGPGDLFSFAKWAGVSLADSEATWAALEPELCPVALDGQAGWILASDEAMIRNAGPDPRGVRLLPLGDPYLWPLGGLGTRLPTDVASRLEAMNVPSRVVNGLAGRVLVDGEIVGAWGRAGGNFTAVPWTSWSDDLRGAVHAEAMSMAAPIGRPIGVRWLGHGARH